jgi:molybdate transport system permease protein
MQRLGRNRKWKERGFFIILLSFFSIVLLLYTGLILSLLLYKSKEGFFEILLSKEVLFSIKLSLFTATLTTIISVIFAIPSSYILSRWDFFLKNIVDTIIDIPIVISPIAIGAALLILFNTGVGMFIERNIVEFVFKWPGIILAQGVIVTAMSIRLLKSTFDNIPVRYENVARTLGCTRAQAFFKITLPLANNGIIASIILSWARAVGEFGATVTLVGATKMKTETLPISIFLALSVADIEKAVTLLLILIFISIIILLTVKKLSGSRYYI